MAPVASTAGGALFALGQQLCNSSFDWSRRVTAVQECIDSVVKDFGRLGIPHTALASTRRVAPLCGLSRMPSTEVACYRERVAAARIRTVEARSSAAISRTLLGTPKQHAVTMTEPDAVVDHFLIERRSANVAHNSNPASLISRVPSNCTATESRLRDVSERPGHAAPYE
jgi:hypothetical protein